ncbi:MAG: iron chelate uptake ABC transporter family permease subunit [Halanaerobium sp.]|nr:iron chelate uptake ABC transporter family permease subunit [Halanaerobium sp.]
MHLRGQVSRMRLSGKTRLIICLFIGVLIFGWSLSRGAVNIPPDKILAIILGHGDDPAYNLIVTEIRLPRIVLSFLVGLSLAVAGVVFQGLLRNPMADPYLVGISSGAGLGAVITLLFNIQLSLLGIPALPLFAFLGALGTVFLVYNLSRVGQKVPMNIFLLTGIALGFFWNAAMSFLMVIKVRDLHRVIYWLMGSFGQAGWEKLPLLLPYLLIGLVLILWKLKDLNFLLLGEEDALSLGVDVERSKFVLLLGSSLITAAAVSVSGVIGFVGLIIPHISRLILGPDNRILLPAAAFTGGLFLVSCDTLARSLLSPVELPVGIITAFFGAPFFVYLLKRKKTTYF